MKKNQWSQSPDWLAGNTALDTRLGIVYDNDPATTIESFVNASLGNQALEEIIADMPEIPALEYALKVSIDFSTNASSAVLGLGVASDTITLAEHHIYGSSRLGIQTYDTLYRNTFQIDTSIARISRLSANKSYYSSDYGDYVKASYKEPWGGVDTGVMTEQRTLGRRYYEMTDHLGNVLATVMDRRSGGGSAGVGTLYSHWKADLANVQDLYPFGMMMPGRYKSMNDDTTIYRFNYNTQEQINEIAGLGNHYTALYWEYDSRIGRRWNIDPVDQISISNYAVNINNPILKKDPNGDCPTCVIGLITGGIKAGFEFVGQVSTNLSKGKSLGKTIKEVDYADVAISFGQGFVDGATLGATAVVSKHVAIGLKSAVDWKPATETPEGQFKMLGGQMLFGRQYDKRWERVTADFISGEISTLVGDKMGRVFKNALGNIAPKNSAQYFDYLLGKEFVKSIAVVPTKIALTHSKEIGLKQYFRWRHPGAMVIPGKPVPIGVEQPRQQTNDENQ